MSVVTDQSQQADETVPAAQAPELTEAQELASAVAGYEKKTRGDEPPVDEVPTETPTPQEQTPAAETPAVPEATDQAQPAPQPNIAELSDELKNLREKVKTMTGDADSVRRLHGEIGNINRTLQNLQKASEKPADAPVDDQLTVALSEAQAIADEYPELAGPLVKAIKTMGERLSAQPAPAQAPQVDVNEFVSKEVSKFREQAEQDAKVALKAAHPDYITVRETPEYKTWLASQTPEYQEMFNNTWNPAVVDAGLTTFKNWRQVQETAKRKTQRLEAAVTPQGVAQRAQPSTLPDEAGFEVGYYGKTKPRR